LIAITCDTITPISAHSESPRYDSTQL
jgi:hypothetical protein